jgi:hypothetical protein
VIIAILLADPVRAKTQHWSETILRKGANCPVYYFWIFFCVGAVLWGALFGGTWLYVFYNHKKNPPFRSEPPTIQSTPKISIHPSGVLNLHSGEWANHVSLTVMNDGDIPVYGVWVKIWTENDGVASEHIRIKPTEDDPHAPIVAIENASQLVEVRSDALMWDFIDSQGHEAVLVRFYRLAPSEPRHLIVSSTAQKPTLAFTRVLEFKMEPDKVITQSDKKKIAFIVQVPESGTLKRLRFKTGKVKS